MKTAEELHDEFLAYRAYCENFLSHRRRQRLLARWMPAKWVSCPCGCGEDWLDDLSDTNWLAQITSIKSFFAVIYHLHKVVKALHGVVWFAVPLFWAAATHRSKQVNNLSGPSIETRARIPVAVRICCLMLALVCWILSRPGISIFVVVYLVTLPLIWSVLLVALVLNAAMLLPFAASLIIGLAAGYFMEDRWWVAVICISVGTVFQYLQHRRGERKRQKELGMVLAIATGELVSEPAKSAHANLAG